MPHAAALECKPARTIRLAAQGLSPRRSSEREPADSLRDKSNIIGDWLPSLFFALGATHSTMSDEFAICDALLWEPPEGYYLLDYHLRRLARSAAHFHFPLDVSAARKRLLDYARQLANERRKVRLDLAATGAIALRDESVKPSTPVAVALSGEPVHSGDQFLHHKTTHREAFDRALSAHPEAQDVLLWNERGEITETCHGNVVLEIEGRRLTPPLSSGLLPGVFRAHLLDSGEIHEHPLPIGSIEAASALFLINSVRRWCEIHFLRQTIAI